MRNERNVLQEKHMKFNVKSNLIFNHELKIIMGLCRGSIRFY